MFDERRWNREVIQKIDIVPEDPNYYDKLAVKPGFEFFYALINCDKSDLDSLKVLIPETLYFNITSFIIKTDINGKISIQQNPNS